MAPPTPARPKPVKVAFPPELPFSIEDPKKLAALAGVLGCTPAMARDILKQREDREALWERLEKLERLADSLMKLVLKPGGK